VAEYCEHGNEPSGFIKFWELFLSRWAAVSSAKRSQLHGLVSSGRAVAQAVSCRLPTAAARVRAQVRSCGICGGQSGTGVGFHQIIRFPLTILIPPTAPH
jgi:hypothetical protein